MLLAVRHARTSFNEDGVEKLRGWLQIPLSEEGIRESHQTAAFLQQLKLPNVPPIHSSPLMRAMQTAHIIGPALRQPVQPTDNLKDWNVGALTGKPVKATLAVTQRFIQKPDIAPAQGESYNTFRQRVQPFLEQLIAAPDLHMAVSHNRVMTLLAAMVAKNDALLLQRGPVEPSGVVLIRPGGPLHVLFKGREEAHEKQHPQMEGV